MNSEINRNFYKDFLEETDCIVSVVLVLKTKTLILNVFYTHKMIFYKRMFPYLVFLGYIPYTNELLLCDVISVSMLL